MAESHREEIAKLEALYASNPEGRVFTHLAEAYRRAGDLDRARDVLERGLQRHRDYASAHVVLGRVLADQRRPEDAARAFTRVLELDPDNLIARRSLAESDMAAGREREALVHYRELLLHDRSDEDVQRIVQQLEARVGGQDRVGQASAPAEPTWNALHAEETWDSGSGFGDVLGVSGTPPDETPAPPAEAVPGSGLDAPISLEGIDFGGGLDLGPIGFGDAVAETAPGDVTLDDLGFEAEQEEEVEARTPAAEAMAPGAPDEATARPPEPAAEELAEPAAGMVPEPAAAMASEVQPEPGERAEAYADVGTAGQDTDGPEAAIEYMGPQQPGVPTETLAALYEAQGLPDRAAAVYRALLAERPSDERLEARARALEAAAESLRAERIGVDESREAWVSGTAAWAVDLSPATGVEPGEDEESAAPGLSIGEYFAGLLGWRRGAGADGAAAPAPEPDTAPQTVSGQEPDVEAGAPDRLTSFVFAEEVVVEEATGVEEADAGVASYVFGASPGAALGDLVRDEPAPFEEDAGDGPEQGLEREAGLAESVAFGRDTEPAEAIEAGSPADGSAGTEFEARVEPEPAEWPGPPEPAEERTGGEPVEWAEEPERAERTRPESIEEPTTPEPAEEPVEPGRGEAVHEHEDVLLLREAEAVDELAPAPSGAGASWDPTVALADVAPVEAFEPPSRHPAGPARRDIDGDDEDEDEDLEMFRSWLQSLKK